MTLGDELLSGSQCRANSAKRCEGASVSEGSCSIFLRRNLRNERSSNNSSNRRSRSGIPECLVRATTTSRARCAHALEGITQRAKALGKAAHYQEPTEPSAELFTFGNVSYSSHIADSAVDSHQETVRACVKNIRATLQNSTTQNLIRNAP